MGRLRRCWMGESHFAMLHQKRDKVLVLAQQVVIQPPRGASAHMEKRQRRLRPVSERAAGGGAVFVDQFQKRTGPG